MTVKDCWHLAALALQEDLGDRGSGGDRTTRSLISGEQRGNALFVARAEGVLAGLPAVEAVIGQTVHYLLDYHSATYFDPTSQKSWRQRTTSLPEESLSGLGELFFRPYLQDGNTLHKGDHIGRVEGPVAGILAAERPALNFLQHLSGVATQTWRYVEAIHGARCQIVDTRKTLPGWRSLQKYAVRCGGGFNHRMGLYDGVLIKDNHLAALGGGPEAIRQAVKAAREKNGAEIPVEVEVENLEMLEVALECGPDIILLDNMSLDQMRKAVRRRNEKSRKVELEASGGITLDNVRAVAETGVDRISVGALTHSAPALDIALDYEQV